MAKAYKCDRCKRYFDGEPYIVLGVRNPHTFSYIDADEHTLCQDCLDKLHLFLEEVPECQSLQN
jgi:DNA-directed RNA polymerase subunit RPC12/RpoP